MFDILKYLPGWRLEKDNYIDPEGRGFFIREERGRLEIHGVWPKGRWPKERHGITIASDKPAEKIAAEIQRRFLPGYYAEYAEQKKLADADAEHERGIEKTKQALVALGLEGNTQGTFYGPNCTYITVQGPDSIRLECRGSFTLATMKKLLRAMQ